MFEKKFSRRQFIEKTCQALAGIGFASSLLPTTGCSISYPGGKYESRNNSLSLLQKELQKTYDIVIIGSGYGGSVLAARLAQTTKLSICLLERGREWFAGDFPKNTGQFVNHIHAANNPLGLFEANIQGANDLDLIAGNGLGGGSLINAAIALQPELLVFQQQQWPEEIQHEAASGTLDTYFEQARKTLQTAALPKTETMQKVEMLRKMAKQQQRNFRPLPLNITYKKLQDDKNSYGRTQKPCTLCGDCCTGCNTGAKNSLDKNYLSIAKQHGCQIFTGFEVKHVQQRKTGDYDVTFRSLFYEDSSQTSIRATHVFLCAGSMGSTELLLRSREKGLSTSDALGSRLSANGDVWGLAYNTPTKTNIMGYGVSAQQIQPSRASGPIIASAIDFRDDHWSKKLEERFLLLDGSCPEPLLWTMNTVVPNLSGSHSLNQEQRTRMQYDRSSLILKKPFLTKGAINHSLLFFACGHDSSSGYYRLPPGSDKVQAKWPEIKKETIFSLIDKKMEEVTQGVGGYYVPNPRSKLLGGGKYQATHPLGGCPMGDSSKDAVVNHLGRVYRKDGSLHPGLFVVDSAIMPRSLGVPPLLTISALAERIAEKVTKELTS